MPRILIVEDLGPRLPRIVRERGQVLIHPVIQGKFDPLLSQRAEVEIRERRARQIDPARRHDGEKRGRQRPPVDVLLRLRWFLAGVLSSLAGVVYAGVKLRRARQRLTPTAIAASGRHAVAAALARTADRIDPPATPVR